MSRGQSEGWGSRPVLVPIDHRGQRARLSEQFLRVGRDTSCDVVIPDLTVSRRHAAFQWDGQDVVVEDLGSSGGTFVNGTRVERAVLKPGDIVRMGPRAEYRVDQEADSTTLELATEHRDDTEGVRHLHVLLEVASALNAATVLEEVLDIVLRAAVRLVSADRGYLVLSGQEKSAGAVLSYPKGEAGGAVESSLLERAISQRRTVFLGPQQDPTRSMVTRGMASAVAAPLVVTRRPLGPPAETSFVASQEVVGGILVERKSAGASFSVEELSVFETLAADAALAIDSARLYRAAREKAKIDHEMALARTIQGAMLREPPRVPFAEVYATSLPARSVGGDLYHTAVRADGSLAVAVGDVSGKGVAAALIMAMVQGQLSLLNDLGQPFDELLPVLDRNLLAYNPGNRFLTMAIGVLAPDGRLQLANGGHCPVALLRGDGTLELVPPGGPLIGLLEGASFSSEERMLAPGDVLVLYSDGISESASPDGGDFGDAGLERTLQSCRRAGPEEIGRTILDAAARHRCGAEADDDVTLLVLRYTG